MNFYILNIWYQKEKKGSCMKIIRLLLIMLLSLTYLNAQQRTKRAAAQVTRSLYNQPRITNLGTNKPYFKSSSRSTLCPPSGQSRARLFTTESQGARQPHKEFGGKQSESVKNSGSRVLEYARANPGKIIGVVSGIGGSAVAYDKFKGYQQKSDTTHKIQQLSYAVGFYNPENIANKNFVQELLESFVQEGIVNKKDRSGNTPVMIVLKAHYVSDDEKATMLKFLFDNGAEIKEKDKKRALNLALGLDENTPNLTNINLKFQPKLKTLKIILPYSNRDDIETLSDIYSNKIVDLQKRMEEREKDLENLIQEKNPLTGFFFNEKKRTSEAKLRGLIESYKSRLDIAKAVNTITHDALEYSQSKAPKIKKTEDSKQNSQKNRTVDNLLPFLENKEMAELR